MNGKISAQPFAELVREIALSSLSGTVRLANERVKAVVYFEGGNAVFAASNIRHLRLGEYITKGGLLSAEQLSALGNRRSDTALASALSSKSVLNHKTIDDLFGNLVADLILEVLQWSEGTWEFDNRTRLADSFRAKIDMPVLLIEGARRMALNFVASRFPDPEETISLRAGEPDPVPLLPLEGFVLSRVDRPMPLSELVLLSGLPDLDALRTIYGLALAGYLERDRWPSVLQQESVRSQRVNVTVQPVPVPVKPAEKTEEEDLEEFLERVENAANHYEIMAVAVNADTEEIKSSYYALARRYHPDRFHSKALVHGRVESAFARITQAYEVLADAAQRSLYDAKLGARERSRRLAESAPKAKQSEAVASNGRDEESADVLRAEASFKDGYAALKLGQTSLAITHLAAAAQAAPQEPRYRAYYGQALAEHGNSARLAEMEMQAAIKLEPSNVAYRMMLAQLYYDLTFYRRARTEAERVIAMERNNPVARTLLRKLESK